MTQETRDKIWQDAKAYARLHRKSISGTYAQNYVAGATEWAGKAEEHLIPALEWIKRYGPCDALTVKVINKALAKYKEVKNDS
jgi:hypothetical protein